MLNHSRHEDLLCFGGKRSNFAKAIKREIKRAHKLVSKISWSSFKSFLNIPQTTNRIHAYYNKYMFMNYDDCINNVWNSNIRL